MFHPHNDITSPHGPPSRPIETNFRPTSGGQYVATVDRVYAAATRNPRQDLPRQSVVCAPVARPTVRCRRPVQHARSPFPAATPATPAGSPAASIITSPSRGASVQTDGDDLVAADTVRRSSSQSCLAHQPTNQLSVLVFLDWQCATRCKDVRRRPLFTKPSVLHRATVITAQFKCYPVRCTPVFH